MMEQARSDNKKFTRFSEKFFESDSSEVSLSNVYEYIGEFGDIDEKTVKRFGITATQIQIDTWPLLYNNALYGFNSLEEQEAAYIRENGTWSKVLTLGMASQAFYNMGAVAGNPTITVAEVSFNPSAIKGAGKSSEVYYRTMSQTDYDYLQMTGELPATGETFISPTQSFSSNYKGVTVRFELNAGTTSQLENIGLRNNAYLAKVSYPNMQSVSGIKWTEGFACFKAEGSQINIGLGKGKALEIFNSNILGHTVVGGN